MKLRYAGRCRVCQASLPAQAEAIYETSSKTVRCVTCDSSDAEADAPRQTDDATEATTAKPEVARGSAGGSARREYERRKAKREARVRTAHPRIGGLLLALTDDPQSTRARERGAVGEEWLGARLDALASADVVVLHDRRIPGSVANIDHIVVTSSRVWVIDAKRYRGRPELEVTGGLFRRRVERLRVNGRDRTPLVDGVLKQVGIVQRLVGTTPVTGSLCFVEADWPLIGGSFVTQGVHVAWPKRLATLIVEGEPGVVDAAAVGALLEGALKPA
jgi:hypothetical protein